MEGWFPKPLEDNTGFRYYQNLFRAQDPSEGIALQIDTKGRPGMERGQWQQWIYKVKYASGVKFSCFYMLKIGFISSLH
jgi:hypothetical protein